MHELAMTRQCGRLTEEQRRCIGAAKTYDDTYPCLGKVAPHAEKKDFITVATSYQTPVLVGPFHQVPVSPKLAARDLDPKLCKREAIVPAWCEYTTGEFPGAIFRVFRQPMMDAKSDADYPVGTLRVTLPGHGVRDKLSAAWGPPRDTPDTAYWFNAGNKLRMGLHAAAMQGDAPELVDLDYSRYMTLDDVIGAHASRFGFEGDKPLLGASASDVRTRFGARAGDGRILLWPVETSTKSLEIKLGDDLDTEIPDVVRGFHFALPDVPAKEIEAALAKKFGAPREVNGELVYRDKPRIALDGSTIYVGE